MPDANKTFNLLHTMLAVTGIAFALSACAYAVMAVRNMNPAPQAGGAHDGHLLIDVFDRYGVYILVVEWAVLAVLAVAAIGADARRKRRERAGDRHRDRPEH